MGNAILDLIFEFKELEMTDEYRGLELVYSCIIYLKLKVKSLFAIKRPLAKVKKYLEIIGVDLSKITVYS